MNPSKKYTLAFIKTLFTHLTLLGLLFAGLIFYGIFNKLNLTELILKFNNPFFYYNNLIIFLLIGVIFFAKTKKKYELDF